MAMALQEQLSGDTQTVEELRRQAESGDAAAQTAWAACLRQGRGVERNKEESVRWLRQAAQQHDPEALYWLGRCAEDGSGMAADESYALDCYAEAARLGHAQAQYAYGMCLLGGIGCVPDAEKALPWLRAAAGQGVEDARARVQSLEANMPRPAPRRTEQPVREAEGKETENEFIPVSPKPYKIEKKETEITQRVQAVSAVGVEKPVTRSARGFIALFVLCGVACGFLMQPVYRALSFRASFDSEGQVALFMAFVGALVGLGISLLLRGPYSRARDTLPFYGLLLLLPLLLFVLAGVVLTVVTTVVNIVVAIVRILLWIVGIVIVLGILGFFFG